MSWWYLQGIHFQNGRPLFLKCWSNIPIFHLYGLRVWEKCLFSLGSWVRWQLTRRRSASWLPLNVSHVHEHPLTAQIQTISSLEGVTVLRTVFQVRFELWNTKSSSKKYARHVAQPVWNLAYSSAEVTGLVYDFYKLNHTCHHGNRPH